MLRELSSILDPVTNTTSACRVISSFSDVAGARFRWLHNPLLAPTAQVLTKLEPVLVLPRAISSFKISVQSLRKNGFKVTQIRGNHSSRIGYSPYKNFAQIAETVGVIFESIPFLSGDRLNPTVRKVCVIDAVTNVAYATSSLLSIYDRYVKNCRSKECLCETLKDLFTIVGAVAWLSGASRTEKACSLAGDITKLYLAHLQY